MKTIKHIILLILVCIAGTASGQSKYLELTEQANQCIKSDSLQKAEELLTEALKLEPTNPANAFLFANLGLVQRRMGEYDKAIDSYSYAINILPKNINITLDRAALYLETGQNTPALYDYNRVLDIEPNNEEALSMRAYIYMNKREYGLARTDYEHILAINPDDYETQLGLITLDQRIMKYKDALDRVNKMMIARPDDAILLTVRADIERESKHEELALIDLDRAIEIDPSLVDAYLLRGDIYLLQNKKKAAKTDFEKAISLGVPQSQMYERMQLVK